jgi:hypothetical protein
VGRTGIRTRMGMSTKFSVFSVQSEPTHSRAPELKTEN